MGLTKGGMMKLLSSLIRDINPGIRGASLAFLLLAAAPVAANVIINGDFQDGNQDFYTTFTYSHLDIQDEHTYDIISDPSLSHGNAESYFDHTFGTAEGLMMAVNGIDDASDTNIVWSQTVNVVQYRSYFFGLWHSLWAPGPAGLQILVNGDPLGPEFMAGDDLGDWIYYEATWESVDATQAIIEIINTTASTTWNDFSLDDLSFTLETALERNTWAGIKSIWD